MLKNTIAQSVIGWTLLAGCVHSSAQVTYTWIGGVNDWANNSNWSPTGIPDADDTAILSSGSTEAVFDVEVATIRLAGGALSGKGNVTVTSDFEWLTGPLGGSGELIVAPGATMTLSTSNPKENRSRHIRIEGLLEWLDGDINNIRGSAWQIDTNAFFRIEADDTFLTNPGIPAPFIQNDGNLRAVNGSDAAIDLLLNNIGTVDAQDGTLTLRGGGSSTNGLFTSQAAGTLVFASNNVFEVSLVKPQFFGGLGTVRIDGATVHLSGGSLDVNVLEVFDGHFSPDTSGSMQSLLIDGGTYGGSGEQNVLGPLTFRRGRLDGTGRLDARGTSTIETAEDKFILGHHLRILDNTTWEAGDLRLGEGALFETRPGGIFLAEVDKHRMISDQGGAPAMLSNQGRLIVTSPTWAAFAVPFSNSGRMEARNGESRFENTYDQIAGSTEIRGGSLHSVDTLQLQGGTLLGGGNIAASILNDGANLQPGLDPGDIDTLSITGNYTQSVNGVVSLDLGGPAPGTSDLIEITGRAVLSGTCLVQALDTYEPSGTDAITNLTATTLVSGTFNAVTPTDLLLVQPIYTGNAVILQTSFDNSAFAGGAGDGNDHDGVQALINGTSLDVFDLAFLGGNADGHDTAGITGTFISGLLTNALNVAYLGGTGDGQDHTDLPTLFISGQSIDLLHNAFGGGNGDGQDFAGRSSLILTNLFDVDMDLIPDLWELEFGLNPGNPNDAANDVDQDGASAREEYVADTDPFDISQVLKLTLSILTANRYDLQHPTSSRRLYQLEETSDVLASDWNSLGPELQGSGSPRTTEVVAPGGKGAWRVNVRVPPAP